MAAFSGAGDLENFFLTTPAAVRTGHLNRHTVYWTGRKRFEQQALATAMKASQYLRHRSKVPSGGFDFGEELLNHLRWNEGILLPR